MLAAQACYTGFMNEFILVKGEPTQENAVKAARWYTERTGKIPNALFVPLHSDLKLPTRVIESQYITSGYFGVGNYNG